LLLLFVIIGSTERLLQLFVHILTWRLPLWVRGYGLCV